MTTAEQRLSRLNAYLAADPDNPHLLYEAADLRQQAGQLDQAAALLDRLFQQAPQHAAGRGLQGIIQLQRGEVEAAISTFQQLLQPGETPPAIHYNLAYALLLAGRHAEAEPVAEAAARHVKELPAAGPLYLRALHYLGKVDLAIAFAEQTLQTHPEHAALYGQLATLYMDNDDLPAADRWSQQVLALAPDDPDAHTVQGLLALGKQEPEPALHHLQHSMNSEPDSGRAQTGLALAAMQQGDFHAAQAWLQQALATIPSHIGTWHLLAWCHIFMRQSQDAKKALLHAMELDRNFADTHGGLAIVAIMEGRNDEAHSACQRALRLDPHSFSARYAQSLLLAGAGQTQPAEDLLNQLLDSAVLPDGSTLRQAVARVAHRAAKRNLES